jgi:flagellin-like hook-associated protein FlgL
MAIAAVRAGDEAGMAEAISRMNQAETAYRAAIGAIGTASRTTLMDYL